jgi:hypothetical protein
MTLFRESLPIRPPVAHTADLLLYFTSLAC